MDTLIVGMGCFRGGAPVLGSCRASTPPPWATRAGTPRIPPTRDVHVDDRPHRAVLVVFDPEQVSLDDLLAVFWENHDPTQYMGQGNDIGSQYRSAIYTNSDEQLAAAEASRDRYQAKLDQAGYGTITTEVAPAGEFFYAEDYHQQYLAANPAATATTGSARSPTRDPTRIDLSSSEGDTRMTNPTDRRPSDDEIRNRLTQLQYHVTQEAGTERAFTGEYWDTKDAGVYRCVVCDTELFDSDAKFDSAPAGRASTARSPTVASPASRSAARHGAHRGPLRRLRRPPRPRVPRRPTATGERYCMNSASLCLERAES